MKRLPVLLLAAAVLAVLFTVPGQLYDFDPAIAFNVDGQVRDPALAGGQGSGCEEGGEG